MNDNYLIHFGNKNSGRYRRGSGERPHQHDGLGFFRKKRDRLNNRIERREIARDSYKLSDEELDKNIRRLDKESRLKDLTKRVNSGRGITNKNLKKISEMAVAGLTGAAVGAIGTIGAKKISNFLERDGQLTWGMIVNGVKKLGGK